MRCFEGYRRVAVFALIGFIASELNATTFVPVDDATLARTADAALIGTVNAIESGQADSGAIYTYVHIQVEAVLRSQLDASEIVLREPGGSFGGVTERLFGVPQFRSNERCLLLLKRDPDGALQTNQLALGKFSIVTNDAGRQIARRDYDSGTTVVDASLGGPYSPGSETRLLDDLLAIIANAGGETADRTTISPVPPELDQMLTEYKEAYTFQATPPARWAEPDSNTPIDYMVDPNGDATIGATNSRAAFDSALAAWSDVAGASIVLNDAGTLSLPLPHYAGCTGPNRVLFNDPYGELAGSGCSGAIGFGGYCFFSDSMVVNGTTFDRIVNGKVVLQNGLSACSGWNQCNLAELLTHEIGHSIGLGHSSENPSEPNATLKDATMYYTAHFDNRCASVHSDDIAGVSFAYPYNGPTFTPTLTATATATASATRTPTITATPSVTLTRTPTPTPSNTTTYTPTRTPTPTSTPTITLTPIFSATPSGTPTDTPTRTFTLTFTPTNTPTITPTSEATPADGISGHVYYYGNAVPVDSVTMQLTGPAPGSTPTNQSGLYTFPGLATDNWTVQPQKTGATNGAVTALDATFILQAVVGMRGFSPAQRIAGDANGSGTLTGIDATLVLQYRVGIISALPVTLANRCNTQWMFAPSIEAVAGTTATQPSPLPTPCVYGQVAYTNLPMQAKNQDYYGIVFGDTTGNWTPPAGGGAIRSSSAARPRVRFGRPLVTRSGGMRVPVSVDGTGLWHGMDVDIHYDSRSLQLRGVRRLHAARGALVEYNVTQPGIVKISAASANGVAAHEPALLLLFDTQGPHTRSPRLRVVSSSVDEG
ncbi:MAG: matrixin family metalloprotease [Deltaproteobacteria bacterium]|nr:matrixin family metalloprotease [Deltaproteobacteria bacterium]